MFDEAIEICTAGKLFKLNTVENNQLDDFEFRIALEIPILKFNF